MATVILDRAKPFDRLDIVEQRVWWTRLAHVESGRVVFNLACPQCGGSCLDSTGDFKDEIACLKCGRHCSESKLHGVRKRQIRRYIETGER